jgi:hypothetical protein
MSYDVSRNGTDVKSNVPMTWAHRAFLPCWDAGHEKIKPVILLKAGTETLFFTILEPSIRKDADHSGRAV